MPVPLLIPAAVTFSSEVSLEVIENSKGLILYSTNSLVYRWLCCDAGIRNRAKNKFKHSAVTIARCVLRGLLLSNWEWLLDY